MSNRNILLRSKRANIHFVLYFRDSVKTPCVQWFKSIFESQFYLISSLLPHFYRGALSKGAFCFITMGLLTLTVYRGCLREKRNPAIYLPFFCVQASDLFSMVYTPYNSDEVISLKIVSNVQNICNTQYIYFSMQYMYNDM